MKSLELSHFYRYLKEIGLGKIHKVMTEEVKPSDISIRHRKTIFGVDRGIPQCWFEARILFTYIPYLILKQANLNDEMEEYIKFIQKRLPLYKDGSRFYYMVYAETELFINEHPDSEPLKHLEEAIRTLCSQMHFKNDATKMEQILNSLPPIVCQG